MSLTPDQLRRHPRLLYAELAQEIPVKALAYARGGPDRSPDGEPGAPGYDELAYRYHAACPGEAGLAVETLAGLAVTERRLKRVTLPADLAELGSQHDYLAHRRLVVPDGSAEFGFGQGLVFVRSTTDGELLGRFPLGAPARTLADLATPEDITLQPVEALAPGLDFSSWLPLDALIATACFPVMREAAPLLVRGLQPGCHHVFVSHRWQTADAPDPEGEQARLLAWHLVAALCEAVLVAHRRSLHAPRRVAHALRSMPVGVAGSELAECLIVGVLREHLDDPQLAALAAEVAAIGIGTVENAATAATQDHGLTRLRALLDRLPALRPLLGLIRLWYDYSCIPQAPRTPPEQALFERTLQALPLLQTAGRTLVLLDDASDYLGRAWCALEGSTALLTTMRGRPDVLPTHLTARWGPTTDEESLQSVLLDRRLVIWRALLDTEVFGRQSRAECLRRLGLGMTDPGDLDHIYDSLLPVALPLGRMSPNALVTGVVPLPVHPESGDLFFPWPEYRPTVPLDGRRPVRVLGSVDWTGALDLRRPRRPGATAPPYWQPPTPAGAARGRSAPSCHLAVVAECEGEAALVTAWVSEHYAELERALGLTVVSVSWTAVDAVPVGHLPYGRLRARAVRAEVWLVLGKAGLVTHEVGQALSRLAYQARLPSLTLALDEDQHNLAQLTGDVAPKAPHSAVLGGELEPHEHPAGLLHRHLYRHLIQWGATVR
ncbi:hypothetical protein [Kitasatospora sp. MMS16-BH015]|uniref:hypothetical protein n=1 Tax=Kitasatospora sp. MMS16-BH015 TaxID=2018025 RepID=UPI000CF27001|nr:hypothetical protein [Kitasatospora sp. MMS16-BH015]